MSLYIGDNFKYGGRKFLDDRESFDTIETMKNYEKVPDGFITYCKENGKRYEFNSNNEVNELTGKWSEFSVKSTISEDVHYIGSDTPDDEEVIWFDTNSKENSSDITINNPLIAELFSCIQMMQKQINDLQAEVEYLKLHGGGGNLPDIPDDPDINEDTFIYFALEDGGLFELEDGGFLILEEERVVIKESTLALEDGMRFLLEDGGFILLEEDSDDDVIVAKDNILLLESSGELLLENNSNILLEN